MIDGVRGTRAIEGDKANKYLDGSINGCFFLTSSKDINS